MTAVTLPIKNPIFQLNKKLDDLPYNLQILLKFAPSDSAEIKIIISSLVHDVLDFMNDLPYWPKVGYNKLDNTVTFTFENPDDAMLFKLTCL